MYFWRKPLGSEHCHWLVHFSLDFRVGFLLALGFKELRSASRTPALLQYGSVPFLSVSGAPGIVFTPGLQDSNSPPATSSFGSKWPQAVSMLWASEDWHLWVCGVSVEKPLCCCPFSLGYEPSIRCFSSYPANALLGDCLYSVKAPSLPARH